MDENKHPNQSQSSRENQKVENSKAGFMPDGGAGLRTPGSAADMNASNAANANNAANAANAGQKKPGSAASNGNAQGMPPMKSRRIFSKRWLYPAIYLGAAALIIGLMYIKSQLGIHPTIGNVTEGNPAAAQATETFIWPVASGTQTKVSLGFFPVHGTAQQQADALVLYDKGWYAHEGYDIKSTDGKSFNVVAALSGKVMSVSPNKLYGNTVEVVSNNGYIEQYQSLANVAVKKGDTLQQGQAIGTSGSCVFEQNQGDHLYFAVYKNGQPQDPGALLPKA